MEVLCELMPVIDTFSVSAKFLGSGDVKTVEVVDNTITFRGGVLYPFTVNLITDVNLKSGVINNFQNESGWLYFTVQLQQKSRIVRSVLGELLRNMPHLSKKQKMTDFIGKFLQLQCICNSPISSFRYFKMRPLPSVDWDSVSEAWFCHLDENDRNSIKNYDLIPGENECYYNELFFGINSDITSVECRNLDLYCSKCSSEIGVKKGTFYKFWANQSKWVSDDGLVFSTSVSEIIVTLFHTLDKESLSSCPRVVFQTKGKSPQFLYIMAMDCHLEIFTTENSHLLNDTSDIKHTPSKKQYVDISRDYNLKKLSSVKVLYKYKIKPDQESGLWADDNEINFEQCSDTFIHHAVSLLEKSNSCLSGEMREVNDMKIGYFVELPKV